MHGWQEKLSTSCRVYGLDFCWMATALGAIKECAGKHLNVSAHLAKNFHRGAKPKTLSSAHEAGTEGECRAMRASHGFLKASFLPHITFPFSDSPVLRGSGQVEEMWHWKAGETGLTLVWEGTLEQQTQKVAHFHLTVIHTRALLCHSRIVLFIHAGKIMDILNSLSHLIDFLNAITSAFSWRVMQCLNSSSGNSLWLSLSGSDQGLSAAAVQLISFPLSTFPP